MATLLQAMQTISPNSILKPIGLIEHALKGEGVKRLTSSTRAASNRPARRPLACSLALESSAEARIEIARRL
jgi:hypothetical protein